MKKNLVLGLVVSSVFLFGNDINGYEENYSFLEPVDMVQNMIDNRKNFAEVSKLSANDKTAKHNFSILKNVQMVDAHRADKKRMTCIYRSQKNNFINALFVKEKAQWRLTRLTNSKHQKLNKKVKTVYKDYESENCFNGFANSFEVVYPNTMLELVGRETQVEGVVIKKQNRLFDAHFNLSYLPLNQYKKSGWYVSNITLSPSTQKTIENNRKVATQKQGFFLREVTPYLPDARLVRTENRNGVILETKPMANLTKLVCSNHTDKGFIRLVFNLDRKENIRTTFGQDRFNHKLIRFNVNSKKAKIVQNSCPFLKVDRSYRLGLDLRDFKNRIVDVKYGTTKDNKKSYLDLHY